MSEREEKFERMLQNVQERYADTVQKMEQLKNAGKTKSVTYKQLMAEKLSCLFLSDSTNGSCSFLQKNHMLTSERSQARTKGRRKKWIKLKLESLLRHAEKKKDIHKLHWPRS